MLVCVCVCVCNLLRHLFSKDDEIPGRYILRRITPGFLVDTGPDSQGRSRAHVSAQHNSVEQGVDARGLAILQRRAIRTYLHVYMSAIA